MEQQHQSLYEQKMTLKQKQSEQSMEQSRHCPNCGTPCNINDKFCEECGSPLKESMCPQCHVSVQPGWEICPRCGQALHAESCSFCGSPMDADDSFCPECGNPRAGIVCSHCKTLNFRSFCRKCNRPLDEMAMQEMKRAGQDPVFREMLALAEELAELEDRLSGAADNEPDAATVSAPQTTLSEADRKLIRQYKEFLAGSATSDASPAGLEHEPERQTAPATPAKIRSKIQLNVKQPDLDDAQEAYQEKLEEMKQLMGKLRPEGDMTPQMQRNYYSARKVMTVRKHIIKSPVCWICNLCGCKHRQPSECAQPQLGGTWIYEDIITATRSYEYEYE